MTKENTKNSRMQMSLWLRLLAVCLIIVGLLTSLLVNFERIRAEKDYRTAGIMVDYDELLRCAQAQNLEFGDVARKAYKAGATGIIVRERLLDDWVKAGKLAMLSGAELELYANTGLIVMPEDLDISESATYIFTEDQAVFDQVYEMLETKKRRLQVVNIGDYQVIQANLYTGELSFLGTGYPVEDLKAAADLGMDVVVRVRNWAPVNQENIQTAVKTIGKVPGLAGVGFNDESLPGGDNPQALAYMAEEIGKLEVPIVSFEFYPQAGFESLANLLGSNKVIRAHAIADNELKKYNVSQALDRFKLAADERNIRYIYVRFFGMDQPVAALDSNLEYIKEVKAALVDEGFELGRPPLINLPSLSSVAQLLLGLSVIAAGAWLLAETIAPCIKKNLLPAYVLLCLLGAGAWVFLLLWREILAVKLAAFCAAVVFPSLGVFLTFKKEVRGHRQKRNIKSAVWALLKMSIFTLIGAMIMCALLRDVRFMLKLDSFVGIKLAHIIPLILVPLALWLRENKPQRLLLEVAASPVKFWHLAAGCIILVALVIYILRTGNTGVSNVSSLELQFRQLLDNLLGVRPRTKEFAIGHPLMLLLLYYGYSFNMYPILLMSIIGQVSLMNTYAHIHTPLLVSLFRSFNGLWLGLLLGCIMILVIDFIYQRLFPRREEL